MSISVRVIGLLVCLTAVEGCMSNQTGVYHDVGESPSFSFSVALPVSGIQSFAVGKEGSNSFLSFSYNSGTLINQNVGNGITFTGDFALGDISFTIDSIQLNDGGTYSLKNILKSETLECKMLTVRGVVSVTLSVTNNPAETHQQVMFVCEANSTTEPPVSSFTYTWSAKSEPLTASADARYTLSGNRLTLADAKTTDSGKYMCIAEENIPSGDTASGEVFLTVNEKSPKPCCCETVVCWVLGIVAIVLIILLVVIHICLIECESELAITDLSCSLFGIRALLPGCCICTLTVIIHIIVYFVKLDDDDCDTVECLVLPLIVKVLSAAGGLVITAIYVYVRGKKGRPGNEKDDSEGPTCFGGNNSILPICGDSGSTQKDGPQRSTHGVTLATKTTHPPDNSSKTGEAGSFVSGKDVKLDTSRFRPQPPLPGIKSEKTTGNPSPIPESGNKTRLDPIGQETQPRYEDASEGQSGEKKKKKKKKRRSKEGEEGGANIEGISE